MSARSNLLKNFVTILAVTFCFNVYADEETIKKNVQEHFAGHKIESLKKTPYFNGLYEVVVGDEVFIPMSKLSTSFLVIWWMPKPVPA